MNKKIVFGIISLAVLGIATAIQFGSKDMLDIKYSLDRNIVETAKATGVPRFSVDHINGLISYQIMPLPTEVAVIYDKPGYEVRMQPVFSFVFSTDRARAKNDIVNASRLTLETRELKSHDAARKYIEALLAQFRSGKWKRHVSIYCPAVLTFHKVKPVRNIITP